MTARETLCESLMEHPACRENPFYLKAFGPTPEARSLSRDSMPQGVRWVGRRASGDDAVEPILHMKVVAHVRDELVVGRVIQRLDANNLRRECVVVLVDVADEVELSRRGPDDENLLRILQCRGDLMKEIFAACMATLLMRFAREVMLRGLHFGYVEALGLNMKNLRFNVINPNSCVMNSHRRSPVSR